MAGVKFKGDFRKLQQLIGGFEKLQTKRFREQMNRRMAETALELAHDGFERSISPYGQRWRNPKYRNGMPLRDTGRLEASIRPNSSATRFELSTNVIYAATHQWGRGPIPQRMFLPNSTQGFGGRWRRALFAVAHNQVTSALGR